MVHFCHKVFAVQVILAALFAAGCYDHTYDYSDYEDHDSSRGSIPHDSSGIFTALSGKFSLEEPFTPKSLTITALKQNLEEAEVIEATISRNDSLGYTFTSDSSEYPTTFAKLTFTCTRSDSPDTKELTFEEYVDFERYHTPTINLLGALESNRVKDLVQNDGFYLGNAKKKASREIFKMLGMEWQGGIDFESDSIKFRALRLMPYLLAGSDNSDSAFAATFKKMTEAVERNTFGSEFFDSLKIADEVLANRYADVFETDSTSFVFLSNLWKDSYGLSACDSLGKQAKVATEQSKLKQQQFVCDMRKDSIMFWKPMDSLDLTFGPCYHGYTDVAQTGDTVYACSDKAMTWIPADDITAIKFLFGECNDTMRNKARIYHDHLFKCHGYGFSIRWTDTIPLVTQEQDEFNAYFYHEHGDCTEENEKEKVIFRDEYYQCQDGKWEDISEIDYFGGDSCTTGDSLKISSHYYLCKENKWHSVGRLEYYGLSCDKDNKNEVILVDGEYFWCTFSEEFLSFGAASSWEWKFVPAERLTEYSSETPPCMDIQFISYKGVQYICKNNSRILANDEEYRPWFIRTRCAEYSDTSYEIYDDGSKLCVGYPDLPPLED
ncbi:hypothetical protein [Fibrobacter sp.]|uniref:hypothetical protein n=1 Tax=Fibrobacter sp. TaxID=35828 RepID=UPI00386647E0